MARKNSQRDPLSSRPQVRRSAPARSRTAPHDKEDFFAKAFRLSPYPIGITELQTGRCLEINDACLQLFGFQRQEVIGNTTLLLGIWPNPEDRAKLIDRVMSEGSVRNLEVSMRMKHGDLRQFLISTDLITLEGTRCLMTIGNDITERKRAENKLRESEEQLRQLNETLEQRVAERTAALCESEERFRAFLNNAPNLAFVKTCEGHYLYVNRRFAETFQFEPQQVVGKTDAELFSSEQAHQFQTNDRLVLETGTAIRSEEAARYADGLHTSLVVKFPVRDGVGRIYGVGGIVTDITYRKQVEEALRQQQAKLEDLTSKLLTAQEHERQRIARDLHDDFTQRLASLAVDLGSLERSCTSETALLSRIRSIQEAAGQLADDVHGFAYRLHPSALEHLGLGAAIRDHLDEFRQRTQLDIHYVERDVAKEIPIDKATCLYHVTQESLQNVQKHARASHVVVRLLGTATGIGVCIHDNGKGFVQDPAGVPAHGLGLISMEERVRLFKGNFRVRTCSGGGTEIHAWIPLDDAGPDTCPMAHKPGEGLASISEGTSPPL